MLSVYNFLYYRLYKIAKKTEEKWATSMRMPEWVAVHSIVLLIFFNLMTIFIFFKGVVRALNDFKLEFEHIIMTIAILYIINYFLFLKKRKYLILEKKLDKKQQTIKNTFIIFYIVISLVLLFVFFPLFSTKTIS